MFLKGKTMQKAEKKPEVKIEEHDTSDSDSDSSPWESDSSDEEQVNIQPVIRTPSGGVGEKEAQKRDGKKDSENGAGNVAQGNSCSLGVPLTEEWEVSGEFHSIEKETDTPVDYSVALGRENLRKNRYGNALPNELTRVKLKGAESDYINANYVQGENSVYIAAQAPLPHTFADFWLMVYEQNTKVVMMLTKLQEKDRTKADVYWPRKGPLSTARGPSSNKKSLKDSADATRWKSYGKILVMLEKTVELNDEITLRYFRVKHEEIPDVEHNVVQIHYTGWPDFGTPENTQTFSELLDLMDKHNKEKLIPDKDTPNGPIILHCSAGLGRTGTLIAAHVAREQLRTGVVKDKNEINMKKIVKNLRMHRAGMVQTSAQYKFLHHLVKEM